MSNDMVNPVGIESDPWEKLARILGIRKECQAGNVTNLDEAYTLWQWLPFEVRDALRGGDILIESEWKRFRLVQAKVLVAEVSEGCGRAGFLGDPNGPYAKLLRMMREWDLSEAQLGISLNESYRWNYYAGVDRDMLMEEPPFA